MAMQAAFSESNSFIVKKTFLELIDDNLNVADPDNFNPLRFRAHSDPALYDQDQAAETRVSADWHKVPGTASASGGEEVEFELEGLSDSDTDLKAGPVDTASSTSGGDFSGSSKPRPESSGSCDVAEDKDPQPAAQGGQNQPSWVDLAGLLRENARLALENQLLKENARLVTENASLQSMNTSEPSLDAVTVPPCWMESAAAVESSTSVQQQQQQQPSAKPAVPPGVWFMPWGANEGYEEDAFRGAHMAQMYPFIDGQLAGCHADAQQPARQRRRGKQLAAKAGSSAAAEGDPNHEPPTAGNTRTTVMLRNLPNNYDREMVLAMIDGEGFAGLYDFIYLPIDFKTQACLGYAFVNLATPREVPRFWETFNGYSEWAFPSKKVCSVTWSGPHQGRDAHVDRYRNSPVMHPSVPHAYKPIVLEAGTPIPFPAPTKTPKAPRTRNYSAAAEA